MADDRAIDELGALVLDRLADILLLAANVGAGDYASRLESRFPKDHPLANLYEGINRMVASLEEEKQRAGMYQRELEDKLATIETQQAAIRELSTPIIEVWEGVLCLPIVGVFDSSRSAEMTEALLGAVVEKKAECAIIDISGIQVMDTATADHFLRMTRAVRLLGARCLLTGINPAIAQTIIHMGLDLSSASTHRSLRSALQHHLERTREEET